MTKFILASGSPRRREILAGIGLDFEVAVPSVDETYAEGQAPAEYVTELSYRKAAAACDMLRGVGCETYIIAADTVVVLDGRCLGKPRDAEDAAEMLTALSGRLHCVLTGVTVMRTAPGLPPCHYSGWEETRVKFATIDREDILRYAGSGEPLDKAGAYGIQERGALFVESVEGDYLNVVGLPLFRLAVMLREAFGVNLMEWLR